MTPQKVRGFSLYIYLYFQKITTYQWGVSIPILVHTLMSEYETEGIYFDRCCEFTGDC